MDRFRIEFSPAASRGTYRLEMEVVRKVFPGPKYPPRKSFPEGEIDQEDQREESSFLSVKNDKFRVFFEILPMKVVILRILSKKEADRFIKIL